MKKLKFRKKLRVLQEVGLLSNLLQLSPKENGMHIKRLYRYYMNINENLVQIMEISASIIINIRNRIGAYEDEEFIRVTNNYIEDLCKCFEEVYIAAVAIRCFKVFDDQFEQINVLTNYDVIRKCIDYVFICDDDTIGVITGLFNVYLDIRNKSTRLSKSDLSKPDGEFGKFIRKFFEELFRTPQEGQKSTDLKTMISSEKGSFNCKLIVDIEHVQKPFIEKSLEIYRDLCEELFMDVLGKLGVEALKQFALKEWFKPEEIPALIYIDDDNYYVHLMDPSSGSVTSLKSYLTAHLWDGMKVSFAVAGISKSLYRTFYNKWSSRISIDLYLESIMVLQ